ncbi:hypothetical protein CEXT_754361 [Caerostris extrusa]|uniref:Uncharacterized protein n=1 Tax=Caerostris extrusa TaxID=172846 RepID=A0AAV4Y8P2_CAEEX|nr:hypothetical protein CEXT_754361 [Caerostris extrusa]
MIKIGSGNLKNFSSYVEYVVPTVEYVEPEIEYFTTTRMSNISKQIKSFALDDSFEGENIWKSKSATGGSNQIDRNRFPQHNEEKMTSETKSSAGQRRSQNWKSYRRGHRRNQDGEYQEIDYPTLEILPVIHFPCEEYASPILC